MKATVSISDRLLEDVTQLAIRMGISRDQVFEKAIRRFVEGQPEAVTEALDAIYNKPANRRIDPFIAAAARDMLLDESR